MTRSVFIVSPLFHRSLPRRFRYGLEPSLGQIDIVLTRLFRVLLKAMLEQHGSDMLLESPQFAGMLADFVELSQD
jgi:hypothetical protein